MQYHCAAKANQLVRESISSSLSAAQLPADSMLSTNNTPNSHDAPLDAPSFASVLSLSLASFVDPSIEARNEHLASGGPLLDPQAGTKEIRNGAREMPDRIAPFSAAGTVTSLPLKKSLSAPEDISGSASDRIADLVSVAPRANPAAESTQHFEKAFSRTMNVPYGNEAIPAPKAVSQLLSPERTQAFPRSRVERATVAESTEADASSAALPAPRERAALASSTLGIAAAFSSAAANFQQPALSTNSGSEVVRDLSKPPAAGRTNLSDHGIAAAFSSAAANFQQPPPSTNSDPEVARDLTKPPVAGRTDLSVRADLNSQEQAPATPQGPASRALPNPYFAPAPNSTPPIERLGLPLTPVARVSTLLREVSASTPKSNEPARVVAADSEPVRTPEGSSMDRAGEAPLQPSLPNARAVVSPSAQFPVLSPDSIGQVPNPEVRLATPAPAGNFEVDALKAADEVPKPTPSPIEPVLPFRMESVVARVHTEARFAEEAVGPEFGPHTAPDSTPDTAPDAALMKSMQPAMATRATAEAPPLPVQAPDQAPNPVARLVRPIPVVDSEGARFPARSASPIALNPAESDPPVNIELAEAPEQTSGLFGCETNVMQAALPEPEAAAGATPRIIDPSAPLVSSCGQAAAGDAPLEPPTGFVQHPIPEVAGRVQSEVTLPASPVMAPRASSSALPDDRPQGTAARAPNLSSTGPANGLLAHKTSNMEANALPSSSSICEPSIGGPKSSDHGVEETSADVPNAAARPAPESALPMTSGHATAVQPTPDMDTLSAAETMANPLLPAATSSFNSTSPSGPVESAGPLELSIAQENTPPNPNLDGASADSGDGSSTDTGKNQGSYVSYSAPERRDTRASGSTTYTAATETLKTEPATVGATPLDASVMAAPEGTSALRSAPSTTPEPVFKGHPSDAAEGAYAGGEPVATIVPSAQVEGQIAKSDIRIALQGGEFGPVELHAKMTGETFSASITVERRDSHAQLSVELPALHQALSDRQLRVSELQLFQNSLSSGGSFEDAANAEREESSSGQAGSQAATRIAGEGSMLSADALSERTDATRIFDSRGRLSVRA